MPVDETFVMASDGHDLSHRVGNMLARVRRLLDRTAAAGGSAEDLVSHLRGRLDALSRREVAWANSSSDTVDLEDLIRGELFEFWMGYDPRITIDGPDLDIRHETALPLALALHELVTNALKFGALSHTHDEARLTISWRMAGETLELDWCETGIALVAAVPEREGFGRDYLEQGLPYELAAEVVLERKPGTHSWHLRVPLAQPVDVLALGRSEE